MNSSKKRRVILVTLSLGAIAVAGTTTGVLLAKKDNKALTPKEELNNELGTLNTLKEETFKKIEDATKANDQKKLEEAEKQLEDLNKKSEKLSDKANKINEKEIEDNAKNNLNEIKAKLNQVDAKLKEIIKSNVKQVEKKIKDTNKNASNALAEVPLNLINLNKAKEELKLTIEEAEKIRNDATNKKLAKEAEKLEAPISESKAKLEDLNSKIKELLKNEDERKKLEKQKLENAIKELTFSIDSANSKKDKYDSLSVELPKLIDKIAPNQSIYDSAKSEPKNNQHLDITKLINDLKEKLELANKTKTILEENLTSTKTEVENTVEEAKTKSEGAKTKAEEAIAADDKNKLNEAKTLLEEARGQLEKAIELAINKDYSTQKEIAKAQLLLIKQKIEDVEKKIDLTLFNLKKEIAELDTAINNCLVEIKKENQIPEKETAINNLKTAITNAENKINTLSEENKTKIDTELTKLKKFIEDAKLVLGQEEKKVNDIKKEIDKEISNIQSQIDKSKEKINLPESNIEVIKNAIKELDEVQKLLDVLKLKTNENEYKKQKSIELQNFLNNAKEEGQNKIKSLLDIDLSEYKLTLSINNVFPSTISKDINNFKLVKISNPNETLNTSLFKLEILEIFANDQTPKLYVKYKISSTSHPEIDLGEKKIEIEKEGDNLKSYIAWDFSSIKIKNSETQSLQEILNDLENNKDNVYETLRRHYDIIDENKTKDNNEIIKISNIMNNETNNTITFKLSVIKENLDVATGFAIKTQKIETLKTSLINLDYSEHFKKVVENKLNDQSQFESYELIVEDSLKTSLASDFEKTNLNKITTNTELPKDFKIEIKNSIPNDLTGVLTVTYKIKNTKFNLESSFELKKEINGFKQSVPTLKYSPLFSFETSNWTLKIDIDNFKSNTNVTKELIWKLFMPVDKHGDHNKVYLDDMIFYDITSNETFVEFKYRPKPTIIGKTQDGQYIYENHLNKAKTTKIQLNSWYSIAKLLNDYWIIYWMYNQRDETKLSNWRKVRKEFVTKLTKNDRNLENLNDWISELEKIIDDEYKTNFLTFFENHIISIDKQRINQTGLTVKMVAEVFRQAKKSFNFLKFFTKEKFGKWLLDKGFKGSIDL